MPKIRIDPGGRKNSGRNATASAGATIGALWGPVGSAIGSGIGDMLGAAIFRKEKTYPIEVDTDTNQVRLLYPDPTKSVNAKTKALAPKLSRRFDAIQAALQSTWDTGELAAGLPKRYRDEAAALLSERAYFYQVPTIEPTETIGAQYGAGNMITIPPGGFAGYAGMTPASKSAFRVPFAVKRRRKSKGKKASGTKRRKKRAGGRKAKRLVKGSAAAKRYMAKIRKKRG